MHLIADNLGWFGQGKRFALHYSVHYVYLLCNRNIEDILSDKGEAVTKLMHDDIVELIVENEIRKIEPADEMSKNEAHNQK